MKEIHYYECEHCGKRFHDADECHKHELKESIDGNSFQAYEVDTNKPIPWPWAGYEFEHMDAIVIKSEEAWDFLDNYIEELGYCSPMDCLGKPKQYPVALFNTDYGDTWIDVEDEFNAMKALKEQYLGK